MTAAPDVYRYQVDTPITAPVDRVVSLIPCVSESLIELSLGARLVGVTDECRFPADVTAKIPRLGPPAAPDADRLRALRPQVIFAPASSENPTLDTLLDALDVPIWRVRVTTTREAFNFLWLIMNVFDEPRMVERVRSAEWALDWLERLTPTRSTPPRVHVPQTTPYTVDLITVCGGTVVPHNAPADIALVDEMVKIPYDLAYQPPAQILPVDVTLLTWFGTRTARALNLLPPLLSESGSA